MQTEKTAARTLKQKSVCGNRLLVHRNVYLNEPMSINVFAILPTNLYDGENPYDGKEADLYDWKADFEAGQIYVRGEIYMGDGRRERIEGTFPCTKEEIPVKSPGRNFVWSELSGGWRNVKTGERRIAL